MSSSIAYGKAKIPDAKTPHIFGFVQSPPTRAKNVKHSFYLQIPQDSSSLSQITINFPYGLTASRNINVSDDSNRKIDTNVLIEGRKVTLMFPQPAAPGSTLKVDMKYISISAFPRPWLYSVQAKFVGFNKDIPIGLFQIRAYR
ncbi:DUF2808 domain-containing protein [Aliterella atlantica]|uniref:DUF2808 domain-containing protein n=1 Tax=Aliterella atlantica TaxID=1827278 RepID=UPI00136495FC|nr:DUF2808 domain-containing protein [Aliterella atlantica]